MTTRLHRTIIAVLALVLLLVPALVVFGQPEPPRVSLPLLANAPPTPTAQPTVSPTTEPSQPTPVTGDCSTDPDPAAAPNTPLTIVTIQKSANPEVAIIRNVGIVAVSLMGWRLCSINGNQEHTLGGVTIQPGEAASIPHSGGTIWNNSERDDAALYDPTGRLVAYWVD